MNRSNWLAIFPFFLLYFILFWFTKDHAFFWDTVQLSSRQAHWYYENNFQYFFLPSESDSGHPPFFGIFLALLWLIFGKSLWVGHLAMMLCSCGILLVVYQLSQYFFDKQYSLVMMLLILVDPFVVGQSILVSPDVVVLLSWLAGIWAIIRQRSFLLFLSTLVLAMISLRGMMLVFILYLFSLGRNWIYDKALLDWKLWVRKALPFIPSGIFALSFLGLHYYQIGWIGYHEGSSWAPSFEKVGFTGMIYNAGLLIWRVLDFGRIFVWLIIALVGLHYFRNKIALSQKGQELLLLFVLSILILSPSMLIHKSLSAHRYLLPITTLVVFFSVYLISRSEYRGSIRKALLSVLFIGLLTGNLWVYPKTVSQGWDSTLAHWPYYELRKQMLDYLETEKIPVAIVGTTFPLVKDFKYIDLSKESKGFNHLDFEKDQYVLYSNVSNEFSDEQITALETEWEVRKAFEKMQICMILYQRKK